jgi:hypothetical protein
MFHIHARSLSLSLDIYIYIYIYAHFQECKFCVNQDVAVYDSEIAILIKTFKHSKRI